MASERNHIEIEVTKPCCDVWPLIRRCFGWLSYVEYPHRSAMPHIQDGETKWRVNFCPSCGAERRNAVELSDSVRRL